MNLRPDPEMDATARPLMSDRRVALIGAVLAVIGPVSMMLFTPAMPELVRVFGTSESVIKLALASYFAGFAAAQLVCGPLSDGFGRKPIVMAFMTIYLLATALALMAPNAEVLIAARFLQGVGAAVGLAIARALVRDLYTTEKAVGVMNLIIMMLSVGPLLAPALGGFTMEFAGWQAIFWMMAGLGVAIVLVVHFAMVETVPRDLSRIRPRALASSYATLLKNRYFVLSSMIVACSLGAIYTLATLLPFILMDSIGLSPMAFGFAMIFQSLSFLTGNVALRMLMRRHHSSRLIPFGLVFVIAAVALMPLPLMGLVEVSLATVMGPVAIYCFGVAFIMPTLSTSALAPFPTMAGAAASMGGFLQMATGLAGALLAGLIGDPLTAFSIVVPLMGILAAISWVAWRKMPEPALARVVAAPDRREAALTILEEMKSAGR
jgi:MFS transporter, DHA1 family, multidrug resistance protein